MLTVGKAVSTVLYECAYGEDSLLSTKFLSRLVLSLAGRGGGLVNGTSCNGEGCSSCCEGNCVFLLRLDSD